MPCLRYTHNGRPAFLCVGGDVYEYEGYRFEIHHYYGPININKKTDDPLVKQSNKFFEAVERWQALPEKEREKYRVERN